MKNRIIYALAIAAGLASCSTYEESVVAPEATLQAGDAVSFTSVIDGTRVTGNSFENSDDIAVVAFDGGTQYGDVATYTYDEVSSSFDSQDPITATSGGQLLSYYATYPAQESTAFSFTVLADQSVTDGVESSSLLTASVAATSARQPELKFSRQMSYLHFAVASPLGAYDLDESAVLKIMAQPTLECDLVADTFETTGEAVEITANLLATDPMKSDGDEAGDGDDVAYYICTYEVIIPAQTLENDFVTLTLAGDTGDGSDDIVLEWGAISGEPLLGYKFEAGTAYSYEWNLDTEVVDLAPATDVQVVAGYTAATISWTASEDTRVASYKVSVNGAEAQDVTSGGTITGLGGGNNSFVVTAYGTDLISGVSVEGKSESVSAYVYSDSDIVAYPITTAGYDGTDATFIWGENPFGDAAVATISDAGSNSATSNDTYLSVAAGADETIVLTTTYEFSITSGSQPAAKSESYKTASYEVSDPGNLETTFDDVKSFFKNIILGGEGIIHSSTPVSNAWDKTSLFTASSGTNGNTTDQNLGFLRTMTVDLGAEYYLDTYKFWNRALSKTQLDHSISYFRLYGAGVEAKDATTATGIADGYNKTRYVNSDEISYYSDLMTYTPTGNTVSTGVTEALYGASAEYLIPDFESMGWVSLIAESVDSSGNSVGVKMEELDNTTDLEGGYTAAEEAAIAGYTLDIKEEYKNMPIRYIRVQYIKAWTRGTQYYEIGEIDFTGSLYNGDNYSIEKI